MLKVAVTGGIASGKSFVIESILKNNSNIKFISADAEVANIYKMEKVLAKISEKLEAKVFSKEDVKALVLKEKRHLAKVEKIIYLELEKKFKEFERAVRIKKNKFCFFEVPLLFEKNMAHKYDAILNVEAPVYLQRRRYLKRNGSLNGFNYFLSLQFSSAKKKALLKNKKGLFFLNVKQNRFIKNNFSQNVLKAISSKV